VALQGKILGGLFGFFVGGPAGALLGSLAGHQVDLQIERKSHGAHSGVSPARAVQETFFRATFQAMGHLAKSDGRVSEQEIHAARQVMQQFGLGQPETRLAIDLFNTGKARDFPLEATLGQLHAQIRGRGDLARMFMQIQIQAALWGGAMHGPGRAVLERICRVLEISTLELARMEALLRMQQPDGQTPGQRAAENQTSAYEVLGVGPETSDADVKKAYRRLMNQNHPDKLVAKGLPESMMKVAEEKTRQVRAAYELISEARGIK
jgi:DnaJ like chaperone protein